MTQFSKRAHRARTRLEQASPYFRWLFNACEAARIADEYPAPQIYTPFWRALAEAPDALRSAGGDAALQDFAGMSVDQQLLFMSAGLTWASWRMTQGIYRFDPALYPHLLETAGGDSIPAEMLMRLTEWCVYVETPGLTMPSLSGGPDATMYGAWIRLEVYAENEAPVLVITADSDMTQPALPISQIVYLSGSVSDGIDRSVDERLAVGDSLSYDRSTCVARVKSWVEPVVNLALYLCTGAEYTRRGEIGSPANPVPKKTRRDGWRLFAADSPIEWDVGVRMGSALRAAYHAAEVGSDAGNAGSVRGHIRRAHWHGFRSGPRKRADGSDIAAADRRFDVRWLPPIPVNLTDVDSLPATIRKVT